jgi:hypothetical protein
MNEPWNLDGTPAFMLKVRAIGCAVGGSVGQAPKCLE